MIREDSILRTKDTFVRQEIRTLIRRLDHEVLSERLTSRPSTKTWVDHGFDTRTPASEQTSAWSISPQLEDQENKFRAF